jgi:hypothetical protein
MTSIKRPAFEAESAGFVMTGPLRPEDIVRAD